MNEEFSRIVIVPIGIAIFVFFIELFSTQARGVQDGKRKYKVWIKEAGELHPELPKHLGEIKELVASEQSSSRKKLVDIVELVSISSYTGFSFDLIAASLTADILSFYRAKGVGVTISDLTGWLVIHLLALMVTAFLVRANETIKPEVHRINSRQNYSSNRTVASKIISWILVGENYRTTLSILLGLFCLITSFIVFWKAL